MPVSRVTIIKAGTLRCEAHEKATGPLFALKEWCSVGGGSTVTYIESDRNILVDTGFDFENRFDMNNQKINEKNLIQALESNGLQPDDIECIVLTHHHRDHTGNLAVFPHAEVITSHLSHPLNRFGRTTVKNGEKIADGVSVLETPGHTRDQLSLIIETDAFNRVNPVHHGGPIPGQGMTRIGIAGDAVVTAGYYLMGKVWNYNGDFYSKEAGSDSMRRLAERCEYIIPGHGVIFKV